VPLPLGYVGVLTRIRKPARQRLEASADSRLAKARPRCETAFFSASVISAKVRPSPSSGANTAS
jgi:hypothetical protein